MPNVRATANPADTTTTVDVGGVTVDQYTSINVELDDIKTAIKDGAAVTVLDDAPFDADEQKEQVAAAEHFRAVRAGEAPIVEPGEPESSATTEAEAADTETHAASQRHRQARST